MWTVLVGRSGLGVELRRTRDGVSRHTPPGTTDDLNSRSWPAPAPVHGVFEDDHDLLALLRLHRSTTFGWVQTTLGRWVPAGDLVGWRHAFREAGMPAQCWLLVESFRLRNAGGPRLDSALRSRLHEERSAFDALGFQVRTMLPVWVPLYFEDDRSLLASADRMCEVPEPRGTRQLVEDARALLALSWPIMRVQIGET